MSDRIKKIVKLEKPELRLADPKNPSGGSSDEEN